MRRMRVAQEFLANSTSDEELFADLANLFALLYAANKLIRTPQGFQSDSK